MHVADLMPTLLEVAGAAYPKTLRGPRAAAAARQVVGPVLAGKAESPRTEQDYLAWELFGNRAVRQGTGSCAGSTSRFGKEDWELFNLAEPIPAERKDSPQSTPTR
jgi:arylsulfatase A-like enzyme